MVGDAERGRLSTRRPVPGGAAPTRAAPGTTEMALGTAGGAWVRVPAGAPLSPPAPR